jgi:hypothetical protein
MCLDDLVVAIKAHALAHYETGGWDVLVECWEASEIRAQLERDKCTTLEEALESFAAQIEVWAERQADADSYRESDRNEVHTTNMRIP